MQLNKHVIGFFYIKQIMSSVSWCWYVCGLNIPVPTFQGKWIRHLEGAIHAKLSRFQLSTRLICSGTSSVQDRGAAWKFLSTLVILYREQISLQNKRLIALWSRRPLNGLISFRHQKYVIHRYCCLFHASVYFKVPEIKPLAFTNVL